MSWAQRSAFIYAALCHASRWVPMPRADGLDITTSLPEHEEFRIRREGAERWERGQRDDLRDDFRAEVVRWRP